MSDIACAPCCVHDRHDECLGNCGCRICTPTTAAPVAVGSLWRSRKGREVLRIERVWQGYAVDDREAWTVRAHPVRGGRPLVTSPEYLTEHYEGV